METDEIIDGPSSKYSDWCDTCRKEIPKGKPCPYHNAPSPVPVVYTYHGILLEKLTREELIEAVRELTDIVASLRRAIPW